MMFHVWHVLAIVLIFILGFMCGMEWTKKRAIHWLMNKLQKDLEEKNLTIQKIKK